MKALRHHILRYLVVMAGQAGHPATVEGISEHFRKHPQSDILRALGGMMCDDWIFLAGDEYCVSSEGDLEYQEAIETPRLNNGAELRRWRDEALSGMTASGKQSSITNAALPKNPRYNSGDVETTVDAVNQVKDIARKMQLSFLEVSEGLTIGFIRWCPRCKQWGEFGKNRAKKSGWATVCKRCRRGH